MSVEEEMVAPDLVEEATAATDAATESVMMEDVVDNIMEDVVTEAVNAVMEDGVMESNVMEDAVNEIMEEVVTAATAAVVEGEEELVEELPFWQTKNFILLLTIILGAVVALGIVYMNKSSAAKSKDKKKSDDEEDDEEEPLSGNSVGLKDIEYIASQLRPDSSHMDVLWTVASTPEAIRYGLKSYQATEKIRAERIEKDKQAAAAAAAKSKRTGGANMEMFKLDEDGWGDDTADDEHVDDELKKKIQLAKDSDEQKKKDREQLAKATGKAVTLLEGIDEGVIGQTWVEQTLAKHKKSWPPQDLGLLQHRQVEYQGKMVNILDHPGLRRNICMITGRLNAALLNAHPELLLAGSKQLVDQTYFKGSMDFRSRCGLLLEAALRTSVALRSKQLTKTIVEVVAMFKIGCYPDQEEWFDNVMMKTYQCLPRLELKDPIVETPDEAEIATGDVATMEIELTRLHAEAFTRQKVAMFQKQGIPPQVALQTYREGWWFLVHGKALEGPATEEGALKNALELKTDGILQAVDKESLAKFEATRFEDRLLTAWPMVVQNVAQKSGKVKMQFPIPSVPGKYRFTVSVHSQDFLGADKDFSVDVTVVDAKTVKRKPKEAVVEGGVDAPAE